MNMKYPFYYDDVKEEYRSLYLSYKDAYARKHPCADEGRCCTYAARMVQKRARTLYCYREIKKKIKSNADLNEILSAHKSSLERKCDSAYYSFLEGVLAKANSVLDIGCGLNPCMVLEAYPNLLQYFCYDKDEDILELLHMLNRQYLHDKLTILSYADWNAMLARNEHFDLLLVQKLVPTLYYNHNTKMTDKIAEVNSAFCFVSGSLHSLSRELVIQADENAALEWFIKRYGYKKEQYVQTFAEFGWILTRE